MRPAALLALLLLGACAGAPPPAPDLGMVGSGRFAEAADAGEGFPDALWWRGFGSPELDRLVDEALRANTDLKAATARLRQADAQARLAGASLLPTLDADLGGGRTRRSDEGAFGRVVSVSDSYNATLDAAWELDLWGGRRADVAGAGATRQARFLDRDAIALTVASSVADTYFQVLSLRDRIGIARANLANARRVLQLVEVRVANGAASALELAQQRTQVATQSAALPFLLQQERQAVDALALLLARPLKDFKVEATSLRAVTPVRVVAGLPSELLRRRPDLAAAEAGLAAAAADIRAARAALYPSLNLTARAGLESDALRQILSQGNVLGIAFSALAPIFEGGRLRARVALSEAQRLELVESYRGAVLQALADSEDALVAARHRREREAALALAATEARRAFSLAEAQYRNGAIDLLDLLDTQRTLFSTEDAAASARLERLSSLTDLYKALGGGWGVQTQKGG